ncbi:MAG: rRNA pseudouridine synthase [Phycisphaeraceae bacterium]|nr:rRNA pseudouridine synthase [Phycisphaeraceae bacterium]
MQHPLRSTKSPHARPEDEYRDASRGERLQRVLAEAGVASRRACEQLIKDGKVRVNGRVLTDLPIWVDPAEDRIIVDGKPLKPASPPVYIMLNKPPRTLCAASDEPGADRATVLDLVRHHSGARLFPVGRLDYDAMGLLLLTNDGDLAHRLTHPKFGGRRVYEVAVAGVVPPRTLAELNRRLRSRRPSADSDEPVSIIGFDDGKTVLRINLLESRGTLVQDLLAKTGHHVKRLERIAFGPLLLKGIARGEWRELERREVIALKRDVSEAAPLPDRPRSASKAGKRKPRRASRAASSPASRSAKPDSAKRAPRPTGKPRGASPGASGRSESPTKGPRPSSSPRTRNAGFQPKNRTGANRRRPERE